MKKSDKPLNPHDKEKTLRKRPLMPSKDKFMTAGEKRLKDELKLLEVIENSSYFFK